MRSPDDNGVYKTETKQKIAVEALLGGFNLIGNLTCELSKSWSSANLGAQQAPIVRFWGHEKKKN